MRTHPFLMGRILRLGPRTTRWGGNSAYERSDLAVAYQSASYLIDIDLTPLKRHIPFKRQRTDREGQSLLPNHVYLRLRLCIP